MDAEPTSAIFYFDEMFLDVVLSSSLVPITSPVVLYA